jgi:hypothetical protein
MGGGHMPEFSNEQVDEIIKEMMPVLKRTGMLACDADHFMAAFLNRISCTPASSISPILKVLRTMPIAKVLAKKAAVDNLCLRAAEEIRLLIETDECASAEGTQ